MGETPPHREEERKETSSAGTPGEGVPEATAHEGEHRPRPGARAAGGVAVRRRPRRRVDPWRLAALVLAVWAVAATLWVLHLRGDLPLFPDGEPGLPTVDEEGGGVLFRAVSFSLLPGWQEDRVDEALPAMERSCRRLLLAPAEREVPPAKVGGRVDDWRELCDGILALARSGASATDVRSFLEEHAVPVAVFEDRRWNGLFTGYYEPLLRGSRRRRGPYTVPLYRRPPELVSVELGDFRDDLAGRRLAGEVVGGRLRPFHSRSRIEEGGALTGRGLELVWVDDSVDAFFLQIQGSGTVLLESGERVRVGYAGQNGHPYYAIGRELVERGALSRDEVSMQSIRAWLAEHPGEGREVMATNASYVFFRELEGGGPVGSQGVELTARRSLAVDRRFIPLGAPVWLHVAVPAGEDGDEEQLLSRLMVAQDTGGAIRGAVRGDVFWGAGGEAAAIAGRMRHTGRYWLLLPRRLAERIVDAS